MSRLSTLLLSVIVLLAAPASHAQALQPLQAIRDAAIAALHADATAQAMLAPGLRLAACAQPLVATPSGAATAQVVCPDTPGWRLFVPVRRKPAPRPPRMAAGVAPALAGGSAPVAPPLQEPAAPAVMLKRGDPVVLRARFDGTEVRMGGRALGPATAGGLVNVENDSSHRIIRGRLAPDGTVEVVN